MFRTASQRSTALPRVAARSSVPDDAAAPWRRAQASPAERSAPARAPSGPPAGPSAARPSAAPAAGPAAAPAPMPDATAPHGAAGAPVAAG